MFSYASHISFIFFFNDTATTEIYTLSLHDALPILDATPPFAEGGRRQQSQRAGEHRRLVGEDIAEHVLGDQHVEVARSEEHTSELQSQSNLVCRLLLEKKKKDAIRELHYPKSDAHT